MKLLQENIDAINRLCKKNKVKSLFAFGSILTNKFNPESDIDLLVLLEADNPIEYTDTYFDLKFSLEELLGKKVDLVEEKEIRNQIFLSKINSVKQLVYES